MKFLSVEDIDDLKQPQSVFPNELSSESRQKIRNSISELTGYSIYDREGVEFKILDGILFIGVEGIGECDEDRFFEKTGFRVDEIESCGSDGVVDLVEFSVSLQNLQSQLSDLQRDNGSDEGSDGEPDMTEPEPEVPEKPDDVTKTPISSGDGEDDVAESPDRGERRVRVPRVAGLSRLTVAIIIVVVGVLLLSQR